MIRRVFSAFRHRDFRVMWFGACTSSVGTWMQKLAQSWLVLQLSGSPFLLGLDAFLGEIPIFLFSLVGGVAADRSDRRRLLLASQVVQMTCAFVLAALFASGHAKVWHILCLSFCVGTAQSFGGPAYQALIPTLVEPEELANAIAMNSIQFNVARIIGPVLGGIALTQLGASWCFSLNGVSFVAVIASLLVIRIGFIPAKTGESVLDSMRQGIGFIRQRPAMPGLIVLAFLMTLLGMPLITFLPVIAKSVFRQGPSLYTALLSISGMGSIFGALIVAATGHRSRLGRAALWLLVLLGGLVWAFSMSRSLALTCTLLFFGGAALVGAFATTSSLVQAITANEMRGRVMSVYNVAFRGGMPIGSLVAGSLMKKFSAPAILACNGVLLICLGVYYLTVQNKVARL